MVIHTAVNLRTHTRRVHRIDTHMRACNAGHGRLEQCVCRLYIEIAGAIIAGLNFGRKGSLRRGAPGKRRGSLPHECSACCIGDSALSEFPKSVILGDFPYSRNGGYFPYQLREIRTSWQLCMNLRWNNLPNTNCINFAYSMRFYEW